MFLFWKEYKKVQIMPWKWTMLRMCGIKLLLSFISFKKKIHSKKFLCLENDHILLM